MAVYFFAMYLLGGSFGPVLTGRLSDYFAHAAMSRAGAGSMSEAFRAAGLHSAMFVIPVCNLLLAGILLTAALTVKRDMGALQTWMAHSPEEAMAVAAASAGR